MATTFDPTAFSLVIAPWLQAVLDTATSGVAGGPSFLRLGSFEACFSGVSAPPCDKIVFVGCDEGATLSPFCSDNPVLALLHSYAHIDPISGHFVLYFGKLAPGGPTRIRNRVKDVGHALPGNVYHLHSNPAFFVAHWKLHVAIDETRARASPICEQLARFFGADSPEFRSKYAKLASLREPLKRVVLATGEHTSALAQMEWTLALYEPWRWVVGNLHAVLAYIQQLTFNPAVRHLPIFGKSGTATYDEILVVSAMASMATIQEKTAARKRSRSTTGEEEEERARKSRRVAEDEQ